MTGQGRRFGLPQLLIGLATVAVAGHLYGLYRTTGPPTPSWFSHADKIEHVVGFAAPVCLILIAGVFWLRRHHPGQSAVRLPRIVVAVFVLHAVVSELVQHFFYAGRTGDPFDVLADWIGVTVGWGLARLIAARVRRSVSGQQRGTPVLP